MSRWGERIRRFARDYVPRIQVGQDVGSIDGNKRVQTREGGRGPSKCRELCPRTRKRGGRTMYEFTVNKINLH